MFNGSGVVFLASLCLVMGKAVYERSNEDFSAMKIVSDGNNKFAFDVLKAIGSSKNNLVASPLSLHVALGFLSQGAKGTTKQQIVKTTHLPSDDNIIQAGFKQLLTPLRSTSTYTLELADAAFIEKTFPVKESFQNVARDSFKADTKSVDFINNASSALDTINHWVEDRTHGKITKLLSAGEVDSTTAAVLVNTLYFNGTWENGFNTTLTKKMPFHVDSKTSVETDMMTTNASFVYAVNKDLDATVVALNYKEREARLLIVLPNKVDGLEKLESSITSMDQIKSNMFTKKVMVTLPKFKIEQETKFSSVLKELGATAMFGTDADFSGISETNQLRVNEVKQKAVIEITEEGTVASAATAITMPGSSLGEDTNTYIFTADHGFLYFLEHVTTNSVIMYGRYTKP